jgi:hypothetical protein
VIATQQCSIEKLKLVFIKLVTAAKIKQCRKLADRLAAMIMIRWF